MRLLFALCALLFAVPASAANYYAELHGTLTSQVDLSFDDPVLKVGDELVMTALFRDEDLEPGGPFGSPYASSGPYAWANTNYPSTGNHFFRIDGAGFTWIAGDDINSGPAVFYADGKVTKLHAGLIVGDTDARPGLEADSAVWGLNGPNAIFDARTFYLNKYKTPGFIITWDFDNSIFRQVGQVPEPATWAMMITGFGLAGVGLRRSRPVRLRQAVA